MQLAVRQCQLAPYHCLLKDYVNFHKFTLNMLERETDAYNVVMNW